MLRDGNENVRDHGEYFAALVAGRQFSLTYMERQVLRWSAAGKSSCEIAVILKRSESAVNFHFCNIREKFGVSSRHTAVLMALYEGLIDFP
ncbi:helix-turn-helix transcriptional regulator [Pseudomonas sp. nanlin1]|uniref:helix-turn-helix domain-containing protein n=1 Tax=Pseudomonas sp. nanlin1 TaxID=3040605 RepID=UPI00388D4B0C